MIKDHSKFPELGAPFPLFDAPASDAVDFVPDAQCSLCGKVHAACFELGIGSDVILKCSSCGEENGLDADDRCDGNCRACGDVIVFPIVPEDRLLCCYPCLRGWMHTLRRMGDTYMEHWARILSNPSPRIVMIGAFNDYTEDSAIWTADSSIDYPKTRLPIERWQGHDGKLHPSMYWDYTVGIIRTLRRGAPKPTMAGSQQAGSTSPDRMTVDPVPLAVLEETRERLIKQVNTDLLQNPDTAAH